MLPCGWGSEAAARELDTYCRTQWDMARGSDPPERSEHLRRFAALKLVVAELVVVGLQATVAGGVCRAHSTAVGKRPRRVEHLSEVVSNPVHVTRTTWNGVIEDYRGRSPPIGVETTVDVGSLYFERP